VDNRSINTSANESPRRTTLLALVQGLARQGHSENEIEHEVLDLVESGRVILIGSFRACPLRPFRTSSATCWPLATRLDLTSERPVGVSARGEEIHGE